MKKIFFAITFFLLTVSNAQVIVGRNKVFDNGPNKNKVEHIELLKNSKTLFILPPVFNYKEYDAILTEVWNINPYEIIWSTDYNKLTPEQRNKYTRRDYSVFDLHNVSFSKTLKSGTTIYYDFHYLQLTTQKYLKTDKKGFDKFDFFPIAAIYFAPDYVSGKEEGSVSETYKEKIFLNYDLGFLKNYFKFINDYLLSNKYSNMHDDFVNENLIKELRNKKLYISTKIKVKFNIFSKNERGMKEENSLTKDYEYPYEFISDEELNEKILNGEDIYYLQYTQINNDKILTVINSSSGEIVYNRKTGYSHNVKSKDLNHISDKIKKS